MKSKIIPTIAALIIATPAVVMLPLRADTVMLKDGSVIHGKSLQIAGGAITITTDFAGALSIKQDLVAGIETDEQVFVKTTNNSTILGKVEQKEPGVVVASPNGSYVTTIENVKSSWRQGGEDPEVTALRRHWVTEISTDVAGKSGNSTGFTGAVGVVATLKTPTDALKFYGSANHSVANGQRSEDMYKGGVEYNAFFSPKLSWYASTELMQDNVKDIALRVSALGGLGYNVARSAKQDLQFRAGLSYRYETYNTVPLSPSFSSAGLDLALVNRLDIGSWAVMNNSLGFIPSFKDASNYVIDHDTNFSLPFGGSKNWSLRLGISNEYVSKPVNNAKNLDTTYYLRFVLTKP